MYSKNAQTSTFFLPVADFLLLYVIQIIDIFRANKVKEPTSAVKDVLLENLVVYMCENFKSLHGYNQAIEFKTLNMTIHSVVLH